MRLILSRKGFDGGSGGGPSPVLPDGRMLSIPIPEGSGRTAVPYSALAVPGYGSMADVMRQLGYAEESLAGAHADPDLDPAARPRQPGWRPVLGHDGAAQRHLFFQEVGPGDLMLFFGLFRETVDTPEGLRWKPGSKPFHAVFGWLQIDQVISVEPRTGKAMPWLAYHPHLIAPERAFNTLYVGRSRLSFDGRLPGAGVLRWSPELRLSEANGTPAQWCLPAAFADAPGGLSFHRDLARWGVAENGQVPLRSVSRGQEFVVGATPALRGWARRTLLAGTVQARTLG